MVWKSYDCHVFGRVAEFIDYFLGIITRLGLFILERARFVILANEDDLIFIFNDLVIE